MSNRKLLQKKGGPGKWDVLACGLQQTPGGWLRTSMPARHWTVGTVRDGDFVESSAHLKGKLGYLVTLGR